MPAYLLYLFVLLTKDRSDRIRFVPNTRRCLCFQPNPKSTTHHTAVSHSATPTATQSLRITYALNAIYPALLRHALSSYATYKKPLIPTNACYVTPAVRCLPSTSPSVNKAEYCLSTRAPRPTSATLRCSSN